MCVWVCTPDRNDLTLGTVVCLDPMSQPTATDFGSRGQGSGLALRLGVGADLHLQRVQIFSTLFILLSFLNFIFISL